MALRIGIDTGGTFTDFVVLDGESISVFKIRSTSGEPDKAVLEGVGRVVEGREDYLLQHGSTVATNVFLERKGAKCVLVTNEGFEDMIEIGRQNRPDLFSFTASRPEPLVSPRMRVGIRERTLWDGTSAVPLEKKSLDWLRGKMQRLKPESVAVVLLYSYLNPENEKRIAEALGEFGVPVSLSHEILPEFREYERSSTTLVNAYVQPVMAQYLASLREHELVKRGRFTVMQSNGGTISSESAENEPVRTLFSGPAGGVVGAFEVASQAGYDRVITLDMGGTSTDVCLCDGRIETTNEAMIEHHPISIQMIGIHSVGAGGGSIAWADEGGLLKVGPRSAGAEPGPICYGTGKEVTVTDANVFLGRLDPDFFLGGEIRLHPAKIPQALEALGEKLRGETDHRWTPREIAEGIIKIVNAQMERALRVASLQKGYDTRDFTLVSFGGAGALHACDLARALLIPRILVPLNPGALSAMGILRSDVVRDASRTVVMNTGMEKKDLLSKMEDVFSDLVKEVKDGLRSHGFEDKDMLIERGVDARYLGQSYELHVDFAEDFLDRFHERHEQFYGYSNERLTVEIINLRVRGRGTYDLPELPKYELEQEEPALDAMIQEKQIFPDDDSSNMKFYLRSKLRAGNRLQGPAVILEYSATTLVPHDFTARIDRWLNIVIEPVASQQD